MTVPNPTLEQVQLALLCLASTDDITPENRVMLAHTVLPHTDEDEAALAVLDVRQLVLAGRAEIDVVHGMAYWHEAGELASRAAQRDREAASA